MAAQNLASLVGRVLLVLIFLGSGLDKVAHQEATLGYMSSVHLPAAQLLLWLSVLVEIGAGLAIVLGWKARWAAALLFLWMIPVTAVFHNPWAGDPSQAPMQMIHLMKNISIMGGLLLALAFGPGRWSVDGRRA
ncbi:MAG TPA: DoxX family protein [Burkholderiales bacterium]|nr:DoxX family protein [Burkholderiales bacterium]